MLRLFVENEKLDSLRHGASVSPIPPIIRRPVVYGRRVVLHALAQRPGVKLRPLPPVNVVDDGFADELVAADPRQQLSPDDPVDATRKDDAEADDAVDVVGQGVVDALALLGRDEGGDDEVDVAEKEEDGDGEGRLERGVPVPRGAVAVEVDEGAGDEDVDDGERVRDEAGGSTLANHVR